MSDYTSGSFALAPPSPIINVHSEAHVVVANNPHNQVPAYISQHNYAQVPNYPPQHYTHTPFMNTNHHQVFGAENAFGPPEITPEAITFDENTDRIGSGSYGTVFKAQCRGHEVAIKIPHQQNISANDLKAFQDEVKMMSNNSHPNIIRLMGACTVPGRLQIVTEICKGGDLDSLLHDSSYNGTLYERLKMARDTAKGMTWLHEITNIIHGDLKPANLLIDSNGQVKITDFGFSQIKKDYPIENSTTRGTLIWMAPEKMLRHPINEKVDVFSFGVILWEVVTRLKPYQNHSDPITFCKAICFAKERPPMTPDIPPPLQHLMAVCWDDNPDVRYSFREILYRLNSIMVDCVIEMQPAANFWKSKFLNRENFEHVEWPVFRNALKEELGMFEDAFFDPIKKYLVETHKEGAKDQEFVTMQKFDKVTKWFGPFFMPEPGLAIINEVNALSQQQWFHGDITRELANACLADKPKGSFLVRLSSTDPLRAPFTLSLPNNRHFHMQRSHEGLVVQKVTYLSLDHFVQKNSAMLTLPCDKKYETRYPEATMGGTLYFD